MVSAVYVVLIAATVLAVVLRKWWLRLLAVLLIGAFSMMVSSGLQTAHRTALKTGLEKHGASFGGQLPPEFRAGVESMRAATEPWRMHTNAVVALLAILALLPSRVGSASKP
ncbi:MAG TPA: hypothetical protein VEH27_09980 [Methylomirabilota bacterium]|nr:hypothetical protein [Methylomirabilota bacterium]